MEFNPVHPDQVLEELLTKGNRRDKDVKLRKLHELCAHEYRQYSQGGRDLSLANISKIAESHGLFKARTIYNAQSKDYVALIKSWQAYNGPKNSKLIKNSPPVLDKYEFLKKIDDPAIRCLCQIAIAERDKIRAELNLLKSKTQIVVDMRPLGGERARSKDTIAVVETAAQLTDSERKALIAAIDKKNLSEKKWRLGDTGEVLDERDRFVFLPGFATAIAKILN